ncbi:MAG TPA: ABC transporter ATP-binding protein [Actinomycetota bacterium]|nr:ABC transporter ATP-binding protein [Actinomycetota bacterium]
MKGAVEVRGVNKSFPRHQGGGELRVLNDVSFSLDAGTFICLVGPSGCGKSTLLRIIDGLIPPDSGEVLIGGEKVREPSLDRGFVFQQFNLLPWRTVLGNVEFGLENLGVKKQERRRRAHEVIKLVDLEGFESYYPSQLSGGMQQRVGLARAIAVEPTILLMDEPFGSVDDQTRMLLQDELLKIWEQAQKTVIFVTHDIEEALYLGDKIVVMRARPSRITRILEVPFGRPRTDEIRGTPEMGHLKQAIWEELKSGATVEG